MLLAFGGTRTFHRLTCAIEDAGFEVRDCLMWLYGSGFPKSLDISKALDKAAGAERKVLGVRSSYRPKSGPIRDEGYFQDRSSGLRTKPATDLAKLWDGWGSSLKPAWEPIILAMKPLDGTFAENARRHGVAGLNIDGARIGIGKGGERHGEATAHKRYAVRGSTSFAATPGPRGGDAKGRWPANLIHDGSDEVAGLFPESRGQAAAVGPSCGARQSVNVYGDYGPRNRFPPRPDQGSAARFFYCAKASKKDRTCDGRVENKHPTVKPRSLMEYLCRLVTPPGGGLILDPFMGSGSTGIGALLTGNRFVGIELEPESFETAKKRLAIVAETMPPSESLTHRRRDFPERFALPRFFSVAQTCLSRCNRLGLDDRVRIPAM